MAVLLLHLASLDGALCKSTRFGCILCPIVPVTASRLLPYSANMTKCYYDKVRVVGIPRAGIGKGVYY